MAASMVPTSQTERGTDKGTVIWARHEPISHPVGANLGTAMSEETAYQRRLSYRRQSASVPVALPPTEEEEEADGKMYRLGAGSSSGSDLTSPWCSGTFDTPPTEGRHKQKRHRDYPKSLSVDASREQDVVGRRRAGSSPSSSTSSSTVELLSKVKEQILNRVFQLAERPHAAVLQDRRQRAVDAFEAKRDSSAEHIYMQELMQNKMTMRHVRAHSALQESESDMDAEMAKLGFRRRSISEETYNRPPQTTDARQPEEETDRKGVICSNDDLKNIIMNHHPQRQFPHSQARRPPSRYRRAYSWNCQPSHALAIDEHDAVDTAEHMGVASPLVEEDDAKPFPLKTEQKCRRVTKMTSMPEVTYDEYGQTWDVYGAEFDPEVLGDAIVKHLEKLMARKNEDIIWGVQPRPKGDVRQETGSDNMLMRWLCFYAGRR